MFGRKNKELDPTRDDPFGGDMLDREADIRRITEFTDLIRNPYVLTLNSPWGSGKTSYVRMWHNYLQSPFEKIAKPKEKDKTDEKYQRASVFFNAWKHDFSGVPMVSLFAEIEDELKRFAKLTTDDSPISDKLKKLKDKFTSFCSRNTKSITPYITPSVAGISECFLPGSSSISTPATKIVEKTINSFTTSKSELEDFRTQLADIATELRGGEDTPPLYIFIDELDRCRPTYAVELLESIKHLFDVDGVIFVLSTDREQLCNTVKALYGEIDSEGYLRRFIDYEYSLPDPDNKKFIKFLAKSVFSVVEENCYVNHGNVKPSSFELGQRKFIDEFSKLAILKQLRLRDIEKIFQSSSILFRKIEFTSFPISIIVFICVTKHTDPAKYCDLKKGALLEVPSGELNQRGNLNGLLSFCEGIKNKNVHTTYTLNDKQHGDAGPFYRQFYTNNKVTFQDFVFKNLDLTDEFKKIE